VDSDVLLLIIVAIGLPIALAILLQRVSRHLWWSAPVLRRWTFCVPVGYLIAIALMVADARFGLTGSGERNWGGWVSYLLVAAPLELLSNIIGVNWHVGGRLGQVRFWFVSFVGVLLLTGIGLTVDGLCAAIFRWNHSTARPRTRGS
jgi:hypothetical protein